jgi:hypothetical protein
MLPYTENILQTLTGKSSLNDVSESELKQIADKYPYVGATQFLLAKKLYSNKTKNSEAAIQKAALHFTNILWLHYNFLEDGKTGVINKAPTVQEILAEAEIILKEEENVLRDQTRKSDSIKEDNVYDENIIEEENNAIEESNISEEKNNTTDESNFEELKENDFENLPETISEAGDTELLDEPETEHNEKLSNLLKEQAAAFEKPAEETALPVEITAYHRIDYFDSQGIKLEDEKANDKLGAQLKRFTDWLKQMKKINSNLNNLETDAAGESQVQNMAEHSNEPKEIVTEAMAEVLVKQGKPEQAIQIYEKLSFFNPSKSAYFAAKIQELKP